MKIFWLPIAALAELIKRPVFWALYPFAYACRGWVRTRVNFISWGLWFALDDSIVADSMARGAGPLEYCSYGKTSAMVEWMPAGAIKEFCRAFYWGAWRNNAINLAITIERKTGPCVGTVKHYAFGRHTSFYDIRRFAGGLCLPYLEWWPTATFRVQCGWISCGRFQVQARTYP